MPAPAVVASLLGLGATLKFIVPIVVTYVLVSLGLTVVTYTGSQFLIDQGIIFINDRVGELPADIASYLEILGFFDALSILLSGVATATGIQALGGFKRLRRK